MAFTLEDGTGIAGSNGYIDDTFADTYHTDRGQTAWLFSDTAGLVAVTLGQKQAAIIRATDHIDRVFGNAFKGYKGSDAQGLQWPRNGAFGPSGYALSAVPNQLQRATAEYALRALLYGTLSPDPPPKGPRQDFSQGSTLPVYGEGEGEIVAVREKVGPLETEVRYNTQSSGSLAKHPAADMLLSDLLESNKNTEIIRG
jgi:hypothetical protein